MTANRKSQLANVMNLAWSFVKKNGFTLSTALKCAWANIKLVSAMRNKIVQFYFTKVDGTRRQAFGTLNPAVVPPTSGRRSAESVQVYYDTEKCEYRCFKRCNLLSMA